MNEYRSFAIRSLENYWPKNQELLPRLSIPTIRPNQVQIPVQLQLIALPNWASEFGVDGMIAVPREAIQNGSNWQTINWWWVIFWYLQSLAEREHERQFGPIHSYSYKLRNWDTRMWERAWVNRIALFLRRWVGKLQNRDERELFGPIPQPEIIMTHDLDAIHKTHAIRLKQTTFHGFNSLRAMLKGEWIISYRKIEKAVQFLISNEEYLPFLEYCKPSYQGSQHRIILNVYGGTTESKRSLKERLIDPGYDVNNQAIKTKMRELLECGIQIGIHPGFNSWNNFEQLLKEKQNLENSIGSDINLCRQHWLRFSFADTWKIQSKCGIGEDFTLGFNDRSGFRNGAATSFHPFNENLTSELPVNSWPLILMDSHLYDYQLIDPQTRREKIRFWIQEIVDVGGKASLLWHPHTLGMDYGWLDGFDECLTMLNRHVSSNS